MRWIRDSRLRGNDGQGAGMTEKEVGSRFRGNDEAPGRRGRRGYAPSMALSRRMDSCLRRNDERMHKRDDAGGRNGGQRAPAIRSGDGAQRAPSPSHPRGLVIPRKREPTGGALPRKRNLPENVIPAKAGTYPSAPAYAKAGTYWMAPAYAKAGTYPIAPRTRCAPTAVPSPAAFAASSPLLWRGGFGACAPQWGRFSLDSQTKRNTRVRCRHGIQPYRDRRAV